jgi:hypothetical protein
LVQIRTDPGTFSDLIILQIVSRHNPFAGQKIFVCSKGWY